MKRHQGPDWRERAVEHIRERLGEHGPPEQRILHCESREDWDVTLLRNTSHHDLHVLGRSTDLIVYFDDTDRMVGWRDDARAGNEFPSEVDREVLRQVVIRELDLPKITVLGECKPDKLAHVGWTHRAALFLAPKPRPEQILRVWIDPKSLKVVQCLRRRGMDTGATGAAEAAAGEVHRLLARRIETASQPEVWQSRPEWYFQVEAGGRDDYDGGFQVRIHTWRHWSGAAVTFETESGEVLADVIDRFATPRAEGTLERDEALAAVSGALEVPPDAELVTCDPFEFAPDHGLVSLEWRRVRGGLPVDGDFLEVGLHPETKRIVRYDRKWRELDVARKPADMTKPEAIQLVEARRGKLDIDPAMKYEDGRQAIVEYKHDRLKPGPTEDRVAWILTYSCSWGWAEVHVDAVRRKVLTVLRSA